MAKLTKNQLDVLEQLDKLRDKQRGITAEMVAEAGAAWSWQGAAQTLGSLNRRGYVFKEKLSGRMTYRPTAAGWQALEENGRRQK